MQKRIGRIENGSAHIRSFHHLLVPGLLQTERYAGRVRLRWDLPGDQVTDGVTARLRRSEVLLDEGRAFTAVLSAGVLRRPLGSFEIMPTSWSTSST